MLLVEELFSLPDTHKDAIDSTNESPLNAKAIGGAKLVNVPTYYKNNTRRMKSYRLHAARISISYYIKILGER